MFLSRTKEAKAVRFDQGNLRVSPMFQFSISLWDQINQLDSGDKEMIAKLMF